MKKDNKVFKLQGKVQHYAWGGMEYLPRLLSLPNPDNKPFAEYWMGAHQNAPSDLLLEEGETVKAIALDKYIQQQPQGTLGSYTAGRFGRLPYLLKILDVKDMLSIQVHPTKRNAEIEFAAENKRGIALNAPDRNYKDDNHKPELMLALSEFWLLHGFKPSLTLEKLLHETPELEFLTPTLAKHSYLGLYRKVMEMSQSEVNKTLQPLLDRILPLYEQQQLKKSEEHFWAARAAITYNEPGKIDRGIFSIYFFNLLNLHPGEAIFQDAGLPHAYLEGQNVEIMANSDNVLRGGLTPKHVDVPELMKHVKFESVEPFIIHPTENLNGEEVYPTPSGDFELSCFRLAAGEQTEFVSETVDILFLLEGKLSLTERTIKNEIRMDHSLDLRTGEAAVVLACHT